jgi:hypothetical protein
VTKKHAGEDLTTTKNLSVADDGESPPNEQQTEAPGVSAAISAAVASGLGNLPSNPEEDDG